MLRGGRSMMRAAGYFLSVVLAALIVSQPAFGRDDVVSVVSFNIQFLGQFKKRDNEALAVLMAPHDLVFVQELVAPPYPGRFPDGTSFRPDEEALLFFEAMRARGFIYVLSEEDTGTGERNHLNSSATEWFVAFYKPDHVSLASDLPHGFLDADRTDNEDFERVPYAFPFRAGEADLVFISVHLQPGSSDDDADRRAQEITRIAAWIGEQDGDERDYVILGDMNIEDCDELEAVLPDGFASLNATCRPTNTNVRGPKPYDHVIFDTSNTAAEIDANAGLHVVDLVSAMWTSWPIDEGAYPGFPYDHNAFRTRYSDHNPVVFRVNITGPDDD